MKINNGFLRKKKIICYVWFVAHQKIPEKDELYLDKLLNILFLKILYVCVYIHTHTYAIIVSIYVYM